MVTNVDCVWADDPEYMTVRPGPDGRSRFLDSVVLVDEAGLFIKGGPDADEYLAFTRKLNLVMMFPSANDMTRKITKLAVVEGTVTLRQLVDGLNALGIGPRDMISILQAVKASGALQAEIEVM